MRLVKVNQSFYDLIAQNHVDEEIMFNEQGRPCVLLINLKYRGSLRKFVVPLRSNISPKAPREQYFALPPNRSTRRRCHHGVHYIKLFPIETKYIDKYRVSGSLYELITGILEDNEDVIVSACQEYLIECEKGNKHSMTPNIDGIISVLDCKEDNAEGKFSLSVKVRSNRLMTEKHSKDINIKTPKCFCANTYSEKLKQIKLKNRLR